MRFKKVSDSKRELIRSLLPLMTGRLRADDRMVLNGILYVSVTGC